MMTKTVKYTIVLLAISVLIVLTIQGGTSVLRSFAKFMVVMNKLIKRVHSFSIQSILNSLVQMGYHYLKFVF